MYNNAKIINNTYMGHSQYRGDSWSALQAQNLLRRSADCYGSGDQTYNYNPSNPGQTKNSFNTFYIVNHREDKNKTKTAAQTQATAWDSIDYQKRKYKHLTGLHFDSVDFGEDDQESAVKMESQSKERERKQDKLYMKNYNEHTKSI